MTLPKQPYEVVKPGARIQFLENTGVLDGTADRTYVKVNDRLAIEETSSAFAMPTDPSTPVHWLEHVSPAELSDPPTGDNVQRDVRGHEWDTLKFLATKALDHGSTYDPVWDYCLKGEGGIVQFFARKLVGMRSEDQLKVALVELENKGLIDSYELHGSKVYRITGKGYLRYLLDKS